MPFFYLDGDITKLKVDAIANAANSSLLGGGGVDGCIHRAAGSGLVRECAKLHGCPTGEAKITGAYRLPCRHVIHTVGPVWYGGNEGEKDLLVSCYRRSLQLAVNNDCHSLAFPLISAGVYGYPKDQALLVASDTIAEFLQEHDLDVFLIIYCREEFCLSPELLDAVEAFCQQANSRPDSAKANVPSVSIREGNSVRTNSESSLAGLLASYLDAKKMNETLCCRRANLGSDWLATLLRGEQPHPCPEVLYALAFALELSWEDTRGLLQLVGVTSVADNHQALLVEYFLRQGKYDIYAANRVLKYYNLPQLGACINPQFVVK